jgi:hypothetical protein
MFTGKREKERIETKFNCAVLDHDLRSPCTVRNISRNGVLTSWKHEEFLEIQFRIGDHRLLEIQFPEHRLFGYKHLRCQARIVRVDIGLKLVAFHISKARFCSQDTQSRGIASSLIDRVM